MKKPKLLFFAAPFSLLLALQTQWIVLIAVAAGVVAVGGVCAVLFAVRRKAKNGKGAAVTSPAANVTPVKEEPAKAEPVKEEPAAAESGKEAPVAAEPVKEEPAAEPAADETGEGNPSDDDREVVYNEAEHRFIVIKYDKSFQAKLIQSDDVTKGYYCELKDELLSYGLKSRVSWKHEAFRKGRDRVAKLQIRGKTLRLYLPLRAGDYEESKYKVEDVSDISAHEDTPCMYRIKNDRRLRYAKELIAEAMKRAGAEQGTVETVTAAPPYERTDVLVERKLIKVLTEEEAQSGDTFRPAVMPSVKATEVDRIMTDEVAATLIEETTRYADRTKVGIVNVDTLSEFFGSDEKITLEEIKARIPGFNKRVTYVKVLARGKLDKPLTVEADDYSIEAVKMILLTGGKAIRTARR